MTRKQIQKSDPKHRLVSRCLVLNKGKVLLIQHKSQKSEKHFWTLPGGLIDGGEKIIQAAQRELMEETNLCADPLEILWIQEIPHRNVVEIIILFENPRGNLELGEDPELMGKPHILDLRWFSLDELPQIKPWEVFSNLEKILKGPKKEISLPVDLEGD